MADRAGAQNGVRYAYFAQARRLAIEVGGRVALYDTRDHQIGGFSQQQGAGGSLTFSSQYGVVDVARLPVLAVDGAPPPAPPAERPAPPVPSDGKPAPPGRGEGDLFALIERLADLRAQGILSAEEFAAKRRSCSAGSEDGPFPTPKAGPRTRDLAMSVDLRQRIVDLSKKAAFAAHQHGIEGSAPKWRGCWTSGPP